MTPFFYNIVLNLKWFCSSLWRCALIGFGIILPFPFILFWTKAPNPGLGFFGLFGLVNTACFEIIGYGFRKFNPPQNEEADSDQTLKNVLNSLLLMPFLQTVIVLVYQLTYSSLITFSIGLLPISFFILLIINRKPKNNEEPKTSFKMKPELNTHRQIRRMRTTSLILGLACLALVFLYANAKIEMGYAEDALRSQMKYFKETRNELNLKIDSLTVEINELK